MPLRLRLSYWLRRCLKMALKTCVLIVGPLLWLLYLYSTNYVYVNQRRLPSTSTHQPSTHPIDLGNGDILRRPTVPIFEGIEESVQVQINSSPSSAKEVAALHLKNEFRTFRRGDFVVMSDALPRGRQYDRYQSITLTTHATYELLDNVVELSRHWAGPIAVAVYAPNTDFPIAFNYSLWLRHCHTSVADYVSFHFIYPAEDISNQTHPESSYANFTVIKYSQVADDLMSKYSQNQSTSCKLESYPLPQSYRHLHNLPYPINVCRNVARMSASTHFVLASDIELYPSANVIPQFLNYSRRHGLINGSSVGKMELRRQFTTSLGVISFANLFSGKTTADTVKNKKVFVLPIFEVDKSAKRVPITKKDLIQLYRERKAVYFHKHVCSFCNIIPRLNKWLTTGVQPSVLDVFMTVKRHRPFNRWEPIYIGTNDDPLYDERFTWEGQQDKMTQMYELCLLNYDLAILDSAFLVHRPGIKTKNATEYKVKATFIAHNNKIYKKTIKELEKKYGINPWCK